MPIPTSRDYDDLRIRVERWLDRHHPGVEVGALAAPEGSGYSSETVLFDASYVVDGSPEHRSYVARLEPEPGDVPVFPSYDLELQYRCMTAVREHSAVPVPVAPWFEPDPEPLGSPFFIMERIDGRVPSDNPPYTFEGWLFDAPAAERREIQRSFFRILADIHRIDVSTADLGFLDRPDFGHTALDQELGYQQWFYDWVRDGVEYPVIEAMFDWLDDNRPDPGNRRVLSWGDSRIGNVMWRGTEPVAVLDWEMAALGEPEADVAWQLHIHRFFTWVAGVLGIPPLDGLFERADAVADYETASGLRLRDVDYYEVLAGLRFGIISIRVKMREIAVGNDTQPDTADGLCMTAPLLYGMLDGSYFDGATFT
ncbi:MAG: phosphotransferase family protein [Acidimicrobiia bacterium]|nr:phosphotransferase family protein [Acidimicrobiia bacterium]